MQCRIVFILATALFFASTAAGQITHGQFSFGDERSCSASGKLSAEFCANAAANARSEFDEKAPRFPTRDGCEGVFGRSGCSLGFSGADGWAGKKSGVYFSPRQAGFRILVSPKHDMIVVPYVMGKVIGFSARTIMRRNTSIDLKTARQAWEAWRFGSPSARAPGQGAVGLDYPSPVGNHGLLAAAATGGSEFQLRRCAGSRLRCHDWLLSGRHRASADQLRIFDFSSLTMQNA